MWNKIIGNFPSTEARRCILGILTQYYPYFCIMSNILISKHTIIITFWLFQLFIASWLHLSFVLIDFNFHCLLSSTVICVFSGSACWMWNQLMSLPNYSAYMSLSTSLSAHLRVLYIFYTKSPSEKSPGFANFNPVNCLPIRKYWHLKSKLLYVWNTESVWKIYCVTWQDLCLLMETIVFKSAYRVSKVGLYVFRIPKKEFPAPKYDVSVHFNKIFQFYN